MLQEFAEHLVAKYYGAVTARSQLLLLAALPVYLVLATLWQYFFVLESGERSIGAALRRIFPREDYQAVTFRTDLFCAFAAHLIKRPLVGLLLKLLIAASAADVGLSFLNATFGKAEFHLASVAWIVALQSLALVLSDEFSIYVVHVLQHKVPILWASHRTHHSAEALTPLTASSRQTILPLPTDYLAIIPIDFAIKGIVLGPLLYWSTPTIHPLALSIMGYVTIYIDVNEYFAHGRCAISFGWLNRVLNAPVLHHIHHSAELHHRDKNFGRTLSIFDWLFGTLYIPKPDEKWRLGLNTSEIGAANPHIRIRDYLLEPYRYAWASLRRRPPGESRASAQDVAASAS